MRTPDHAMILAAGLGTRMRPITEHMPKPLVTLGGKALLDHAIDRLAAVEVKQIVVNLHYKGEMIADHLVHRHEPNIRFSHEEELLETGGGILKALPLLDDVFYAVNGDIFWLDSKVPALARLARAFDPEKHDAVLLLQRTVTAIGYDGPGDFILDPMGLPRLRKETEIAPHLFAGVQIMHRRLFADAEPGKFSLHPLWDRAMKAGRLAAIVHDGEWYHIGTPEGLAAAEIRLATQRVER
jgi:N-acetyl-alpha-D-muramate 1-phosphate uridylyltransferase